MQKITDSFIQDLKIKKNISYNTEMSYRRDLAQLFKGLRISKKKELNSVTEQNLKKYFSKMQKKGSADSTVARKVASAKSFFSYAYEEGIIKKNPAEGLLAPRVERKHPDILTARQVDKLLSQPSGKTPKEYRDKAMLELLYATGMRVSELLNLNINDIDQTKDEVICRGREKDRKIFYGSSAKDALDTYIKYGRPAFFNGEESDILFPNVSGQRMSRQGFWKIIKKYGEMAGIKVNITPHTIRHSFAAHMVENGTELKKLQSILGHTDLSTTQIYTRSENKRLKEIKTK